MGSKANPTVIGAFVVGAVVLIVAAILLFSGGQFFTQKNFWVMYFDGAVTGLSTGAPVRFRGVQIGQVKDIIALHDPKNNDILIEVIVETTPGHIIGVESRSAVAPTMSPQEIINIMVKRGLRASLASQSMLTGLLYVELDFHPDTPVKLWGLNKQYVEVPTVPSTMAQMFANVQTVLNHLDQLPLNELLTKIIAMFDHINTLLTASRLHDTLIDVNVIAADAKQALKGVIAKTPEVVKEVEDEAIDTLKAARAALVDVQRLLRNVNGQVDPLSASLKVTLSDAQGALQQAKKALADVDRALRPTLAQADRALASAADVLNQDSVVITDLSRALREIEETAKSIRVLADMIQRNPEVLLRGKGR